MIRARGDDKADQRSGAPRRTADRPSRSPYRGSEAGILALQSSVGNRAVVQMLRETGEPRAQERHQHGAGCGHQGERAAVQRAAVPGVPSATPVQRAETHEWFEDAMNEADEDHSGSEMSFEMHEALNYAPPGTKVERPTKEMDAGSRLSRVNARHSRRALAPKADVLGSHATPFGPVSLNAGYPHDPAPHIKSNKNNYPGTGGNAWTAYADLLPRLDAAQRPALADALKSGALAEEHEPHFTGDAEAKRAAAVLHGMGNQAEERRFPGASKALRSALRRNGGQSSVEGFLQDFPMAQQGGAQAYNRIMDDPSTMTPGARRTLEGMSESSEDDEA